MEILSNARPCSQVQLMGLDAFSFPDAFAFLFISNCAPLYPSAVASTDIIESTENVDNSIFSSIIMSAKKKKANSPILRNEPGLSRLSKQAIPERSSQLVFNAWSAAGSLTPSLLEVLEMISLEQTLNMSTINIHTAVSRHAAGDLHLLRPHRCECSAARTGPFPLGLERPLNELPSLMDYMVSPLHLQL